MAEHAAFRPMRLPVITATGAQALTVGIVAEGAAQATQSLTLTIVAGAFVLAAAIVVPIINHLFSRTKNRPATDVTTAQAELLSHIVDHFSTELADRDARLAECADELARLRRRRRA